MAAYTSEKVPTPPVDPGAGAVAYATLCAKHKDYDAELWHRLRLLYRGGYDILRESQLFLPPAPEEAPDRYKYRTKYASYYSYPSMVIGYLLGCLFSQSLSVTAAADADNPQSPGDPPDEDFYKLFAEDVDRKGTPFDRFMANAASRALMMRKVVIGVDMPKAPGAETLADEEAMGGGRAYCFHIPLECLINWEFDDEGKLIGAVLQECIDEAATAWGRKARRLERFKVWRVRGEVAEDPVGLEAVTDDSPAQFAEYAVFETRELLRNDDRIQPTELVSQVVPWTATTFRHVPIEVFELPRALWVGGKAGPLAEKHFRKTSDLDGAIAKSLVEVGYIKQGPEIGEVHGAMPSAIAESPHRGQQAINSIERGRRGWVVLGSQDEIGYAGPSGVAFELADKQCKDVRDEIFRTVHAMALSLANTSASVQRSGDSKREDRSATAAVLKELGALVRAFAIKLYGCVSDARNEDDTIWTAHGLDVYDDEDRATRVEEAVTVEALAIKSPTFRKIYETRTALSLVPNASPQEKELISEEIKDGVDEAVELGDALKKAALEAPPQDDQPPNGQPAPAKKPPPFGRQPPQQPKP